VKGLGRFDPDGTISNADAGLYMLLSFVSARRTQQTRNCKARCTLRNSRIVFADGFGEGG
jgi:hypothetical protein